MLSSTRVEIKIKKACSEKKIDLHVQKIAKKLGFNFSLTEGDIL